MGMRNEPERANGIDAPLREIVGTERMATRYRVSLAHHGCKHTGFVVWEERDRTNGTGGTRPIVVRLPRGFVSLTDEEMSVEIMCTGCLQTVASASFRPSLESGVPGTAEVVEPAPEPAAIQPAVPHEAQTVPDLAERVPEPTAAQPQPPAEEQPATQEAEPALDQTAESPSEEPEEPLVERPHLAPTQGDGASWHLVGWLRRLAGGRSGQSG